MALVEYINRNGNISIKGFETDKEADAFTTKIKSGIYLITYNDRTQIKKGY